MANTEQARKRVRQAEKRKLQNASQRSRMRTYIKRVVAAIGERKVEQAELAYQQVVPIVDRLASKGLIHKNKAARHKSRLLKQMKAIAAA